MGGLRLHVGALPFLLLAFASVPGVTAFSYQVPLQTSVSGGTNKCNINGRFRIPSFAMTVRRTPLALRASVDIDPEDSRIPRLAKALEMIGVNPEDSVAMFSYDSSEQAILMGYAVVGSKGQPIVQTPDVEHKDLVAAYKDNRCVGVITPDEESMKMLMDGNGPLTLQSGCGWDPSSPVGPRFCVVMSSDKKPEELQDQLGCLGREEDPETGLSFQVGLPVECHTFESLLALAEQ